MSDLLADPLTYLYYAVIVALVFGAVVFVHELGHFLMARMRGVGVEAFAIGMGPKIVAWKYGSTEYSLRWLPIGGFVRLHQMVREDAAEQAEAAEWESMEAEAAARESELERAAGESAPTEATPATPERAKRKSLAKAAYEDLQPLYDKGFVTKVLVFGGGVTFNFITAVFATATLWTIGFEVPKPPPARVVHVEPGSKIEQDGLRTGDTVLKVEGKEVETSEDVERALGIAAGEAGGTTARLEVLRESGETAVVDVTIPSSEDEKASAAFAESWAWGYGPHIGAVIPFGPADKAGLKDEDRIVSIDGEPIEYWHQMVDVVRASTGRELTLLVSREGVAEPFEIRVTPEEDVMHPGRGQIQIVLGGAEKVWMQEPFHVALMRAPGQTALQFYRVVTQTISFFANATFGQIKKNVGGPIMIMTVTKKRAEGGFRSLLEWFISFNLILAFMNLLPIPVLDGGFIVLATLEAVLRRPVPTRILEPVFNVFVIAFLMFFVMVSYWDVMRFF